MAPGAHWTVVRDLMDSQEKRGARGVPWVEIVLGGAGARSVASSYFFSSFFINHHGVFIILAASSFGEKTCMESSV